jgi:uncharacterized protein DUF5719
MNHAWFRRYALPGSVLLTLALVYLAAWATGSAGPSAAAGSSAPQTVPVTAVTRDCPPPGPGTGQAHVAMLAVPPRAATATPSTAATATPATATPATATPATATPATATHATATHATATPAAGAAAQASGATTLTAVPSASGSGNAGNVSTSGPATPNAPTLLSPPQAANDGGTEVAATGRLAQGFAAEQAAADGTGTVTCTHPDSDMWFVGTGTDTGGSTVWLYLMNTGAMAASVDVTVLTDAGVQSGQDNETTVAPHRYLSMNLATLAKGSTVLAVHVQTSSGQVAADLWQGGGSGGTWLPLAASPATRLVVPGLTAANGAAKLLVAVPGTKDAQLRVTALTTQGKVQPLGTMPVDAAASATSGFSLNSVGVSASALVISSNVPVTAGVQVPGDGIGGFTAAAAPITGQGVVAGNPSGGDAVGLVLSAPGATGRAAITVLSQSANPDRPSGIPSSDPERVVPSPQQTLTVQSGRTVQTAVSPPKGAKGPFAIVVTPLPGSGPLYAARVVMSGGKSLSGTLQSLLPVPSAAAVVQLPSASDSYSAVLP